MPDLSYIPDPALVELAAAAIVNTPGCYHWGDDHPLPGVLACDACQARSALAALATAGRLQDDDAVTEWGWLSADTVRVYASLSEAAARRAASRSGARKSMRRQVGPWLPAPTDTDKISEEKP